MARGAAIEEQGAPLEIRRALPGRGCAQLARNKTHQYQCRRSGSNQPSTLWLFPHAAGIALGTVVGYTGIYRLSGDS
jgi:hypothetical protein